MLNKVKNRKEEGFTIIEVLIVLAIAALILVVVLIAVPNLQRNQRNSARKDEAARILTAANNYVANNNGAPLSNTSTANGQTAEVAILADAGTLQQYSALTNGTTNAVANGALTITNTTITGPTATADTVAINTGRVCSTATPGNTTATGANPRSIVVVYTIERSNGSFGFACVGSA